MNGYTTHGYVVEKRHGYMEMMQRATWHQETTQPTKGDGWRYH